MHSYSRLSLFKSHEFRQEPLCIRLQWNTQMSGVTAFCLQQRVRHGVGCSEEGQKGNIDPPCSSTNRTPAVQKLFLMVSHKLPLL